MNAPIDPLVQNALDVRRRLAEACARAGRAAHDVRLVAVTKYYGPEIVGRVTAAGITDVGENRVDAFLEKRAACEDGPTWHFIGHLQRNKVRKVAGSIDVFHAGDGLRLLRGLDAELARLGRTPLDVLVQVNVSGEGTKGGFRPDELPAVLPEIAALSHLRVRGLMTMAPASQDPEEARPVFSALREMRDEARVRGYLDGHELSMGMSGDFEVAVEEGATIVRIGRILYGGVEIP